MATTTDLQPLDDAIETAVADHQDHDDTTPVVVVITAVTGSGIHRDLLRFHLQEIDDVGEPTTDGDDESSIKQTVAERLEALRGVADEVQVTVEGRQVAVPGRFTRVTAGQYRVVADDTDLHAYVDLDDEDFYGDPRHERAYAVAAVRRLKAARSIEVVCPNGRVVTVDVAALTADA